MRIPIGRALIELVKLNYAANIPVLLSGVHGCGKSESLIEAADELGIGHRVFDLSLMEPSDLVGLPRLDEKTQTTRFAAPASLPTSGSGLLICEELNRSPRHMQSPCLQLLTARRLNDYILPDGWLPVAAINPPGEDYLADALDPALMSRFTVVDVYADVQEWVKWAKENQVHPKVIDFVSRTPRIFESSNPRSWTYVSDTLIAAEGVSFPEAARCASIAGLVGDVFARALLGAVVEHPLAAEEILQSYSKARKRIQKWIIGGKTDLLQASAHALALFVQAQAQNGNPALSKRARTNIDKFLHDLPGDLAAEFREVLNVA